MRERLIIAGSGGQGIVLIGRLLAVTAVDAVPHVTFFPSYGAEVRGGTSNCQVVLASEEIASPVCELFDSAILMNQTSADRFLPRVAEDGWALIDGTLCRASPDPRVTSIDATAMAGAIGNVRAANFIMLGAYLARRRTVSPEAVERLTRTMLAGKNPALVELNIRGLKMGLSA